MTACLLCQSEMQNFIDDISDWEYGVPWNSRLEICPDCGLVSQSPRVIASEISALYPENYLAHSPVSGSGSLYGRLKKMLARHTARRIASHVPTNGTLLEIGCGNGHLLTTISDVRPDIKLCGVDIEDLRSDQMPDFRFFHGQFEQIDIEPNSIDLIYCSNLIEHVPDPLVFSDKIHSTLRTNGVLLGVTPDHLSLDRYLFGKYWAGYHYPRHTFVFNHHNIRNILGHSGLADVDVKAAYSFWYLSFANRLLKLPGTKKRGILFVLVTAFFLPLDLMINLFRVHGSMTFMARKN